jgi:hypothetical protein
MFDHFTPFHFGLLSKARGGKKVESLAGTGANLLTVVFRVGAAGLERDERGGLFPFTAVSARV